MSEKLYTISLKGERQTQPWAVVNADSAQELDAALDDLTNDLLQKIADVNSLFQGVLNATAGLAPVQRASAPAGSDEPAQETQAAAAAPARQRGSYGNNNSGGGYGRKKAVAGTGGQGGKRPKLTYEEASADCKHGERRRFTKPGADWVAYFCPQPKGQDECPGNFIDADMDQES